MSSTIRYADLLLAVAAVFCTACSDEYTDMSTEFRSDLCVVQQRSGQAVSLLTDGGMVLNPVSELDSSTFEPGLRFMVTYILMDSSAIVSATAQTKNYSIRIKDIQSILIKPVVQRSDATIYAGEDPFRVITSPWIGGGFLNLELLLWYENANITHSIWLVADSTVEDQSNTTTYLTLLHNANGDSPVKTTSTLVSFRLNATPDISTSDSLILTVKEWLTTDESTEKQYRVGLTSKQ